MELRNPISQSSKFSLFSASDSQILSPSYSLSLSSEPPDITNWFPSYRYESPVAGTSGIFGDSICEESGVAKEKLFVNDSESTKVEESLGRLQELEEKDKVDKSEQQSSKENFEPLSSPYLHSEPIDVRNWFSSYVYESPALDTSDGFRDSVYKETEREGDDVDYEESNKQAKINGKFQIDRIRNNVENSDGLINYNSCADSKQEKQSFNKAYPRSGVGSELLSNKSNTCLGSALKQCSKYVKLQNHESSTSKDVAGSNSEPEDSQCTQNISIGIGIMPLGVQRRSEKSHCTKGNKREFEDGFLSAEIRSLNRCNHKENKGGEISNDGFVTTRKGRFGKASEGIHLETRKGHSREVNSHSTTERRALAERTNFQLPSVTEITGKWKCPQKGKPNLGPPLKQLRLERWVNSLRKL